MESAYPSLILGYHGCDTSLAEHVVAGKQVLKLSQNDYDWLGDGIYFWEHNAQRAYDFAKAMAKRPHPSAQSIKNPAVIGAIIDLGYCLNLLDTRHIEMVRQAHRDLKATFNDLGRPMPQNTGGTDKVSRKLDCAVIRALHEQREQASKPPFDTVRAMFAEGEPLYENAGFSSRNHIQICVRDHHSITGYFRPLDEKGKPLLFH